MRETPLRVVMGFSLVSSIRSALINESNLFALRGFLRGFHVEDRALASGGTSDGFGSSWMYSVLSGSEYLHLLKDSSFSCGQTAHGGTRSVRVNTLTEGS